MNKNLHPNIVDHPWVLSQSNLPFRIFLDLDGVFADLEGKFKKLTGLTPTEYVRRRGGHKGAFWKVVMGTPEFFLSLDQIKGSEALWKLCQDKDPIFLTGAPSSEVARQEKRDWVVKMFGPQWQTIVLPKKLKCMYAQPNHILIDDTQINIDQWNEQGGIGILHKGVDYETTIKALQEAIQKASTYQAQKVA